MEMNNEEGGRTLSTTSSRDGIGGGSNRIVALEVIASNLNNNNNNSNNASSSSDHHYHSPYYSSTQEIEIEKAGWRKFLSYVGPGFLIAIVYLDPGNFATDLQAGANHGYQLLWVMLIGTLFSLIIQSLAVNIGVTTGKHLSELCKVEYPLLVRYCLWLMAEVAVIAADIPEVVGTAFALNILFHVPVWAGVLFTGFTTLLLLSLQRYGVRKLEMLISMMILVIGLCFFVEMGIVKPSTSQVLKGMFVPNLSGQHTIADVIALLGAIITPQNLFLHSALVLSRKIPSSMSGINDACKFFFIETAVALLLAFLINVAIVSVSGTVCSANNLSNEDLNRCNDLNLKSASFLLKNALGRSGKSMYGIALLASGQSTAVAGTFAGQFIMQGFLDMRMKAWKRNIVTRSIAITPSLIVAIISGSSGAGRLIIVASMILAFGLPFALIPLLKFSNSSIKMGPHKSSTAIIVISWVLAWGIIGINVYYLSTGFVNWLTHNSLPKVAKVLIGIIVFPLMAIYGMAIVYLTLRKDTVQTFIDTTKNDVVMEKGDKNDSSGHIHIVREDLMDMDPTTS